MKFPFCWCFTIRCTDATNELRFNERRILPKASTLSQRYLCSRIQKLMRQMDLCLGFSCLKNNSSFKFSPNSKHYMYLFSILASFILELLLHLRLSVCISLCAQCTQQHVIAVPESLLVTEASTTTDRLLALCLPVRIIVCLVRFGRCMCVCVCRSILCVGKFKAQAMIVWQFEFENTPGGYSTRDAWWSNGIYSAHIVPFTSWFSLCAIFK